MFTGIVEATGAVVGNGDGVLRIDAGRLLEDAALGASVAVDGVCLTVTGTEGGVARFDLSPETLDRTTLGDKRAGDRVNLERPVTIGEELGGHIVQGHVDGVATVVSVSDTGRVRVRLPAGLCRYVVEKGSVTLDGVSLTITELDGDEFSVALVPHTLAVTTFGACGAGRSLNVEVDVLAKYVERLVPPHTRGV
jgi:riboflavin synthase